jgi:hypothetical protein
MGLGWDLRDGESEEETELPRFGEGIDCEHGEEIFRE